MGPWEVKGYSIKYKDRFWSGLTENEKYEDGSKTITDVDIRDSDYERDVERKFGSGLKRNYEACTVTSEKNTEKDFRKKS